MRKIELVDLKTQYLRIKAEVDAALQEVMDTTSFIGGPAVKNFTHHLSDYLGGTRIIPCANGTDALQICMMALGLKPGDEVITPTFTYAATAEVIALLGLVPVFVDAEEGSFNLDITQIEKVITSKTKAIVPVHLFGQCADMENLLPLAKKHGLFVIEDVAQAIGAKYTFKDGSVKFAGSMGHMGGISFFPSKNLGCFGDGGAITTTREDYENTARMIANHGQTSLYYHDIIGVNSRLDSIQAAILNVKLKYLDEYTAARDRASRFYDQQLNEVTQIRTPYRAPYSTHVFHQYTLTCNDGSRDELKKYMDDKAIPCRVYYPVPLHLQKAYNLKSYAPGDFPIAEKLAASVISLPMHSELDEEQQLYICDAVKSFYK